MSTGERQDGIWAMLANWKYYDSLAAANAGYRELWLTGGKPLQINDPVLYWQTKDNHGRRGVVGLGIVASPPAEQPERHSPYMKEMDDDLSLAMRVEILPIPLPNGPLWIDGPHAEVVSALSVSRGRGSSTFYVTMEQWTAILNAAGLTHRTFVALMLEALEKPNPADNNSHQGFGGFLSSFSITNKDGVTQKFTENPDGTWSIIKPDGTLEIAGNKPQPDAD